MPAFADASAAITFESPAEMARAAVRILQNDTRFMQLVTSKWDVLLQDNTAATQRLRLLSLYSAAPVAVR